MAFIGLIIFILQKTFLGTADAVAYKWTTFIYALLILLWSIIFSEQWKRRQKIFAIRYGQDNTDALSQKVIRSGFEGEYIRDKSMNEMNVLYYSALKRLKKYFLTFTISSFIICLSVATSLAILLWKKSVGNADIFMNYLITGVNAIQIIIFQMVYDKLSIKFTNYENHATLQQYRDSLILKRFFFNFFNTFNSFVLIAFVKPHTDIFGACIEATNDFTDINCFFELGVQV